MEQNHIYLIFFSGKAPYIEIETSTFAPQWKAMLDNPEHSDVTFIVDGQHRLVANFVLKVTHQITIPEFRLKCTIGVGNREISQTL